MQITALFLLGAANIANLLVKRSEFTERLRRQCRHGSMISTDSPLIFVV